MPIHRPSRRDVLRVVGLTLAAGVGTSSASGTSTRSTDEMTRDGDEYVHLYEELVDSTVLVQMPGEGLDGEPAQPGGIGSGFVIDDHHLVTNDHVVMDAEEVDVQFSDQRWRSATVDGTDPFSDLAVLGVEDVPDDATPLAFVDEQPAVGTEVVALGNPLGLDASISRGIVSGVNRSLPSPAGFSIPAAIQTDAAVNPGNSGGPLVNLDGDVVGVVFAGAGATIGFAISALLANRVLPALIEDGEYEHPFIGIAVAPVSSAIAAERELEEARGVLVVDVVPDSPADGVLEAADVETDDDGEARIEGGDVIVELAGADVPNQDTLSAVLALDTEPDETIELEVLRNGDRETLELTLDARPEANTGIDPPGRIDG